MPVCSVRCNSCRASQSMFCAKVVYHSYLLICFFVHVDIAWLRRSGFARLYWTCVGKVPTPKTWHCVARLGTGPICLRAHGLQRYLSRRDIRLQASHIHIRQSESFGRSEKYFFFLSYYQYIA